MNDHIGFRRRDCSSNGVPVEHVECQGLGAVLPKAVRPLARAGSADDVVACLDQLRNEAPADCSRCPYDKDSHVVSFLVLSSDAEVDELRPSLFGIASQLHEVAAIGV